MYSGEWKADISWSVALCGSCSDWKSRSTYETVHASVETVIHDELVRHLHSERFHRVLLSVVKRSDFVVVKVGDSAFRHKLKIYFKSLSLTIKGAGTAKYSVAVFRGRTAETPCD